jgi:uncharacterized protein involved in exopolysaccharide biosynthesis
MANSLDKSIDLQHYFRLLWRRKGIIILCSATAVCVTAISLTFIPKEYQSEVTLVIEDRRPLTRELEQVMGGSSLSSGDYRADEARLSKLVGRVKSRPFLERVVRILRMEEDPTIRAQAAELQQDYPAQSIDELAVRILVRRLENRIQFGSAGPGIFRIIVSDYSPENAQLLAKWISELFVDVTIQTALDQIRTAREFGAEQLRIYEEELARSEEALEQHKGSLIEVNFAQNVVRAENLLAAEALLRRMKEESATLESLAKPISRAATQAGLTGAEDRIREGSDIREVTERLYASLEKAVRDRLAVEGSVDPLAWPPQGQVENLWRQLYQALEIQVETLFPDRVATDRDTMTRHVFTLIGLDVRHRAIQFLEASLRDFKTQAQSTPENELELSRLENEVAKNRQLLASFRAQLVASDVSQAVETTNLGLRVEILDPAQAPLAPSRPNKMKILLAAMLVGPLLGAAFALLVEVMDPTLRSLDEIRRLSPEPVLGITPLLGSIDTKKGLRRYWIPGVVTGVLLLTVAFFVMRGTVLRDLAVAGRPVQTVNPEEEIVP